MSSPTIEPATEREAAACSAIYAPYVRETAISFELEPPGEAEFARRIAAAVQSHAWLVGRVDGRTVGYAYGAPLHPRPAFRWACEVSVYLEPSARGGGLGAALYGALLQRLAARSYVTAIAGLTLPNEASVALHRRLGFREVGTYRRVGFKFGTWHDVLYMQRDLAARSSDPLEPG